MRMVLWLEGEEIKKREREEEKEEIENANIKYFGEVSRLALHVFQAPYLR